MRKPAPSMLVCLVVVVLGGWSTIASASYVYVCDSYVEPAPPVHGGPLIAETPQCYSGSWQDVDAVVADAISATTGGTTGGTTAPFDPALLSSPELGGAFGAAFTVMGILLGLSAAARAVYDAI